MVTKLDRLARSTSHLYRIVSQLAAKGVEFKVLDDPAIDITSRTGKLVMGILALIAEFENDIRRERQIDGIVKARERGVRFGRKPRLVPETVQQVKTFQRLCDRPRCQRHQCTGLYRRNNLSASDITVSCDLPGERLRDNAPSNSA